MRIANLVAAGAVMLVQPGPGVQMTAAGAATEELVGVNVSTTLTDGQAADLMGGKWYVNSHTAANKGGEIRGQVVKK